MKIFIIPVGAVKRSILERLAAGLRKALRVDAALGSKWPIPEEAYDFRRRQYYANAILDDLADEFIIEKRERVLAVIDADMHIDSMNFIFGLADRKTGCCLVSLARLRPEFAGMTPDEELFFFRVLKESAHEIGHTLGLKHCSERRCAMHFSDSVADTDKKKAAYCPACKKKFLLQK